MFTWWAPWRNMRQRNIGWRLDYLLASQSIFDTVRSCVVQKDVGTSDHAPVVAEFGSAMNASQRSTVRTSDARSGKLRCRTG